MTLKLKAFQKANLNQVWQRNKDKWNVPH